MRLSLVFKLSVTTFKTNDEILQMLADVYRRKFSFFSFLNVMLALGLGILLGLLVIFTKALSP